MEDNVLLILELYEERQILSLVQLAAIVDVEPVMVFERVNWLYQHGYVCLEPRYARANNLTGNEPITINTPLLITLEGQAALQNRHRTVHQQKKEDIRYIITTVIAVAALITAIVSIVLQYL